MEGEEVEVAASQLGTKEYWDGRYEMEMGNFLESGDEGEVWFGRAAENRIIKYLSDSKANKGAEILDLGCGNGSVLRRLRQRGFSHLTGVDYCEKAVELARAAAEAEEEKEGGDGGIRFEVLDILSPPSSLPLLSNQFHYVLDKGTWDAMSLSEDKDSRLLSYVAVLHAALSQGGIFIIFSCNFTCPELRSLFQSPSLLFVSDIPASHSITFGGKAGVTSSGAVFQRKSDL